MKSEFEVEVMSVDDCYVYLSLGHSSFTTGKVVIVKIPDVYMFLKTYVDVAKAKACKELGLDEDSVIVFDYKFLGDNVLIC